MPAAQPELPCPFASLGQATNALRTLPRGLLSEVVSLPVDLTRDGCSEFCGLIAEAAVRQTVRPPKGTHAW